MMKLKNLTACLGLLLGTNSAFAFPNQIDPLEKLPFANQTESGFDLQFNDKNYRLLETSFNGQTLKFRAFEKIVYVKKPVEVDYQTLNFYVPEAYFEQGEINGFTAQTAPIFLPNDVGGYMPARAGTPQLAEQAVEKTEKSSRPSKPDSILFALSKGYVVASVGARGRTLGSEGNYTGKAPAAIVDLKSAVKYLHANDAKMVGDANKIISNGTSAGGALSALLGASGNHQDYEPYFKALGVAKGSDQIFAVSSYCPITNLENADTAYEWEFNGLNEYSRMDMSRLNAQTYNDRSKPMAKVEGTLDKTEIALSDQLKTAFPNYLNSLNLTDKEGNPLTLAANGEGAFKTYLANIIAQSADNALQAGADLSDKTWVKIENGRVVSIDWQGYIHSEKRMKSPPAFDALDLNSGENQLFGDQKSDRKHFTTFSQAHSQVKGSSIADENVIKMMNAMNYLENPNAAPHWRIRVGTADRDTSHAISAILATKLTMLGKNVDYATPWGVPHSGDYDLDELFQWADSISKTTK